MNNIINSDVFVFLVGAAEIIIAVVVVAVSVLFFWAGLILLKTVKKIKRESERLIHEIRSIKNSFNIVKKIILKFISKKIYDTRK